MYFVCIVNSVYIYSSVDKVNIIFNLFDIYPNDDYLGYAELELFQRLTDPQLPLDKQTYIDIIKLLGGNIRYGLTIEQFNSSYYLFKNELGTDIHRDFKKIQYLIQRHTF